MNYLRKILFPFALIYGLVTGLRNFLFDKNILKSHSFDLPVIAVGNLSVGGTGKTPQIEYLIRLLSDRFRVATLSRGYKRKSEGFVLADSNSNAKILGDEPFQYFQKFPNIQVAVDANRSNGINQLLNQSSKPEIILLDDAYQHRKVKADLYILLTAYNDLYTDDYLLPMGNLRESRSGARRSKIVIVTKCPQTISEDEKAKIKFKLNLQPHQQLFFTTINYDDFVYSEVSKLSVIEIKKTEKVLIAGIAKPEPFFNFLKKDNDIVLKFPDHHHFSSTDIAEIKSKVQNKLIITTEKDFVRLSGLLPKEQLFYLPIKSAFVGNGDDFDSTIFNLLN